MAINSEQGMILDGPARDKRQLWFPCSSVGTCKYTCRSGVSPRFAPGTALPHQLMHLQVRPRLSGNCPPVQALILIRNANPVLLAVQHARQCRLRQFRAIVLVTEMGSDQVLQTGAIQTG